jgi:hypothetical protein
VKFRDAMAEAILGFGFDYKIEDGPTVKAVDVNRVRDAFYNAYVVVSEAETTKEQKNNAKRKAFVRSLERAQAQRLIAGRAQGDRHIVWMITPFEREVRAMHKCILTYMPNTPNSSDGQDRT